VQFVAGTQAQLSKRPQPYLRRVLWVAGQLFSFETALLLFIFVPAYRPDPRLAWFPGDMTLVFFGLSVIAGAVPLLRGSLLYIPGIKALCAGAAFVLWIAASQIWSPSEIYASQKVILVIGGDLWGLIATAMIIGSSRIRVWRFLILLLIFSTMMAVEYAISAGAAARGADPLAQQLNYLSFGRLAGFGALVAFGLWLQCPPRSARSLALLAAFALCGYVILKAGGRNPAAAVAIPMLLPLMLSFRLPRARLVISRGILAGLGLIAVLAIAVTYLAVTQEGSFRTLGRFDMLVTEKGGGNSAAARLDHWRHAVAFWVERPVVGHGVGAWPVLYFNADFPHYPHNLILEVLVELGLIGLGLFAVVVVVLAHRVTLQRLREDPALMCALMLCINAFINAMTTGDLADNRNFFIVLGLLAMRSRTKAQ
jgi:O-antigen ligase